MSSKNSGRFSIIPTRAIDDKRLGRAALHVLNVLGTYGDRDGWCWPSVPTIAERIGVTRQAIQHQLKILKNLGYIEIHERPVEGDKHRSNKYRILFDATMDDSANSELAHSANSELALTSHINDPIKDSRTSQNLQDGSSDEDDEIREILGDEVIERNEKIRANSTLVRKGTQAALHEGIMTESDLKTRVMRAFSINPKWERKDWRSVLQFLKERPLEETIERWARWWKSEDWRGKEGQPPTASQIEELWPQAFRAESGEVRKNEDGSFYL